MEAGGLGKILALAGLMLLLFTSVGRQQARRQQQPPSPGFVLWQRWGRLAALGLVLVGLILMALAK